MLTMNNMHLLIKDARERRGFRTQGELAERIGRDVSWVSRLERGYLKEIPQPEMMDAIASALGLTVADMLRAAGYAVDLPPEVEFLTVAKGDPRARILEIMQGLPDDRVEHWVTVLEVLEEAASTNTNHGIESPEGNDAQNRSTSA